VERPAVVERATGTLGLRRMFGGAAVALAALAVVAIALAAATSPPPPT